MMSVKVTPLASVPLFVMVVAYSIVSPGSALLSASPVMMVSVMVAVIFATARTIRVVPSAAVKAINRDNAARWVYILIRVKKVPGLFFLARLVDARMGELLEFLGKQR